MLTSTQGTSRVFSTEVQGARSGQKELGSSKRADLSSKAVEFESILLGEWLQSSERSFGSVPGADEDEDAGADQLKSFAFQHLASGLAEKGGIGLAKMVGSALTKEAQTAPLASGESAANGSSTPHATATVAPLAGTAFTRQQAPERAHFAYAELQDSENVSMLEGR